MPSKNKARGNRLERLVVNQAKEMGIDAIRAYASNGLSLGEAEDVDVKIDGLNGQCKMRKKIASFMKPPESCDIALIKEDREDTLVVIRYPDFLEMLKAKHHKGGE
tara:strand:- start:234 stop:551 length:318 start_codon:yes stop_codon:yes gene_type:complete